MAIPTYDIDLSSDTKTKPSAGMRQAMFEAEVGDEQMGEDPTVNRLLEMVCKILDKEKALFLPSGTMCNQIAVRMHCQPGDEIIADETCHIRNFETGGFAALSGASLYPVRGERGIFTPQQFLDAIRYPSNYDPRTAMVTFEQTSNRGGGSVWPLEYIRAISEEAVERGIGRHMDGARLFNAVVKSGIPAREYASHVDSIWIDFSKGLGAPIGAALAGTEEFIEHARRWKHQFGGAMRQAGIVAAGAIYALDHNIERMQEDHDNADLLAEKLDALDGIRVGLHDTNMVFFDVQYLGVTAEEFNNKLSPYKLRFSVSDTYQLRAVTHLDVSREQVLETVEIVERVIQNIR